MTADPHLGELGHRGRVRTAVGRQDRVGTGRPGDQHRQGDDREGGHRGRDPPRTPPEPVRGPTFGVGLIDSVEPPGQGGAVDRANQHRQDGQQTGEPAADHERDDTVDVGQVDRVDGRPVRADPDQLEHHHEHCGSQQHRPPRPHHTSRGPTHEQAGQQGDQRLRGGQRPTRHRDPQDHAEDAGDCDDDGRADPAARPHRAQHPGQPPGGGRRRRCGHGRIGGRWLGWIENSGVAHGHTAPGGASIMTARVHRNWVRNSNRHPAAPINFRRLCAPSQVPRPVQRCHEEQSHFHGDGADFVQQFGSGRPSPTCSR